MQIKPRFIPVLAQDRQKPVSNLEHVEAEVLVNGGHAFVIETTTIFVT